MMRETAGAALACALLMSACGTTASPPTPARTTAGGSLDPTTPTASSTNYLPVHGATLTEPGTALGLGDKATVAWRPETGPAKASVAAIEMKVDAIRRAPLSVLSQWQLPKKLQGGAAYLIGVKVHNVGPALGGTPLPLYAVVPGNVIVQASTFAGEFVPCPSPTLPKKFPTGARTRTCQLYLLPKSEKLIDIAFVPSADIAPVTWYGKVTPYQAQHKKKRS